MRACTAVVTEMSWNSSDNENERYRAEIKFISAKDWEHDLRISLTELIDGNGQVRNAKAARGAMLIYAGIARLYECGIRSGHRIRKDQSRLPAQDQGRARCQHCRATDERAWGQGTAGQC